MATLFPEKLLPRKILQRIIPFLELENTILLTGARQTEAFLENFVFTQPGRGDDLYQKIRFWRSHSKKEVDFVWQAVECRFQAENHPDQAVPYLVTITGDFSRSC